MALLDRLCRGDDAHRRRALAVQRAPPASFLGVRSGLWLAMLTAARTAAGPAGRRSRPRSPAAALPVAAFTVDAALGAPMQPGSMLNSRPIYGLRWYGFGNVTFAAYASAGLLLAGYVAPPCLLPAAAGRRGRGRRRSASAW